MLVYIIKRLLLLPLLLFVFSVVAFILIQAPPGDFVTSYVAELAASGSSMGQQQIEALRSLYGLDQPLYVQYLKWITRILQGDFGVSLDWQKPISELIGAAPGADAGARPVHPAVHLRGGDPDRHHLRDAPVFVLRLFLHGVQLPGRRHPQLHDRAGADVAGLLLLQHHHHRACSRRSTSTRPGASARVVDLAKHLWLPVVILGLDGTARLARIMRANLLDELHKPYMEMARAKGMSEWRLVLKYPVRLAINPLVSSLGWYLPLIFSGSLIVATVLNLPTIGPLLLRSLISQDMFLAGTIVLIYFAIAVIGTLLSDILLAWLDPRIRMET